MVGVWNTKKWKEGRKERFFVYARPSAITIFLLIIKSRMRHRGAERGTELREEQGKGKLRFPYAREFFKKHVVSLTPTAAFKTEKYINECL